MLQGKFARPLRILDLGAGPGSYWQGMKLSNFLISSHSELTLFDATTEFDAEIFPKGVIVNRILGTVPNHLQSIPTDSYDFVLAIDLIEHLSKSKGYLLLYEMDRISKGSCGLLTPNGFTWQPPSENNPYNAHISGWTNKEFRQLGWKVMRGQIGYRRFYEPYSLQKYRGKSHLIREIIAIIKIIVFFVPSQSFSIFVLKRIKNPRIQFHK